MYPKSEYTSYEEKLESLKKNFRLGEVIAIHDINGLQIVQYFDKNNKKNLFNLYIDFSSTYNSYHNLDNAILSGLCKKYLGQNEKLSMYISQILFN